MDNIFLFTGYDRVDLIDYFIDKNITIRALIIPSIEKYIKNMSNIIARCSKYSIPIMSQKSIELTFDQDLIQNSVLYSSGYPLIISQGLFKRFKHAINCHPSLLPRNRGKYLEYILLNNDEYSGTTLHYIDEGCDSGPIILQESFKVEFTDTVKSLLSKSYSNETLLLDKLLNQPDLLINPTPQNELLATTYITQRNPENSLVDHSISLLDAYMLSRAFDNEKYPGFFIYNGYKVVFKMEATPLESQ